MYTEEEHAKWRRMFKQWKETGESPWSAGIRKEQPDATTVQRQEPVQPIKRDFVAEATRKHAAEAVGPDTRSQYQREQSQSAKQYANQQYQKAKDDAKRAEGLKNLLTLTQPSTYIEAATGKDLGDAGRLAADLAFGGVVTIPKKISSRAIKDAAYKAAVESGNKQEAYRLLEEAYLNSGVQKTPMTITSDGKAVGWYHGSEWGNHTIFDSSAMNATIGGTSAAGKIKGNFLTTDVPSAVRYAGHGRYTQPNVPEYTSPQNFVEKLQNFFGMYKPRKLYPAERVGDYAPRPERLFDTEGKPPIDHLSKTDNVVYPMYVNPGENPMILDFKGNPWSRSPVEFPNNFYLKRWVRDDVAKTYKNEIVPFKNYDDAFKAWNEDPINVHHGKSSLKEQYFDDGIRSIEGFNSAPRYETVKLVEERIPNTTNGAVQTAAREGNTSVLIRNVIDSNGGPEGAHYAIDDLVTLKPEQMKLADITYDDTGNLIPLSQRFNWNLKDIRYGMIPLLGGAGYAASLPKYEDGYESFLATLPDNQKKPGAYNTRRYWELNGKPKNFAEAIGQGMYTFENDNAWHANSVAYNDKNDTYEFMKPNYHETRWMEQVYGYDKDPEFQKEWKVKYNGPMLSDRYVRREKPGLKVKGGQLPKFEGGEEKFRLKKTPEFVQAGKDNSWSKVTNDSMGEVFQSVVARPNRTGGNTSVGSWKKQWEPKQEKGLEIVSPEFEALSLGGGIKQMMNVYKHIPGLKIKNLKHGTTSWIHQPKRQPYVRKPYSATWDDFQTEPKFGKYFAEGGEAEVYESFDNPGYLTKVKLKIPEEGVTLEDLEYAVNRDLKMNQLPGVEPITYKGFSTPKIIRKSLKQDTSLASDEFVPIWEQKKLTPLDKTKVGSFDKTTYDDLIREWIARNGYKEDVLSNMLNYGNITISDYVPKNFAFDAFGNMKLIDPMIQTF